MKGWERGERVSFLACAAFIPLNLGGMVFNLNIGGTWNGFVAGIGAMSAVTILVSLHRQWVAIRRTVWIRADIVRMEAEIAQARREIAETWPNLVKNGSVIRRQG